jgi:hypothetical protein
MHNSIVLFIPFFFGCCSILLSLKWAQPSLEHGDGPAVSAPESMSMRNEMNVRQLGESNGPQKSTA